MAEQDSFINEVTEEVRRDRLFSLVRRYGWIAVLLIVLVVGGAAWNEWRNAQARAQAEALGDAIIAALNADDPATRAAALEGLGGTGGEGAIVGLVAAAQIAETGDVDAATARLDAIASDPEIAVAYRDLATLKSVMLSEETASPADRVARLEPLTTPGAPYRLLAMEQIALARVAEGDVAAALDILGNILADGQVREGLRRRASQLIVALGGSVEAT